MKNLKLEDFPLTTFDKLRYSDTDRQGHVNNATFVTFLETGRVELIYNSDWPILSKNASFVIVSLQLNFTREIKWPGRIEIGTGVTRIGNSSINCYQQLFQNGIAVANAQTTIVQVDNDSSQSKPLSEEAKKTLTRWMLPE